MSTRFGVAGNSDTFTNTVSKSSLDAPAWLAEIGLDHYEYQCGRGVRVKEETARLLGEKARQSGITLSIHAPYFISLSNPDPVALDKNIGYVTASCQAAKWMGAERIVVHSGALMKRTRREAMEIAKTSLKAILNACDEQGYGDLVLCPETMGKINQLGDLDEVLELCALDERLLPCVDFGHLYARTLGELNGAAACKMMLWARSGPAGSTATSPKSNLPSKGERLGISASLTGAGGRNLRRWPRRSPGETGVPSSSASPPEPRARTR